MHPNDPCLTQDREVCNATRALARALVRRLAVGVLAIDPRVRIILVTWANEIMDDDTPHTYQLWSLHDGSGVRTHDFSGTYEPLKDPWRTVQRDANRLAMLADDPRHPSGYYYVHRVADLRDRVIILPANPRGPIPRTLGVLQ